MSRLHVYAARTIRARAEVVYPLIADYRDGHPRILPSPPFGRLFVEEGGLGEGTVIRFSMTAFGTTTTTRARITEPDPGRVLVETIIGGSTVTTFSVMPFADGTCRVSIETDHEPSGIRGIIERLAMPRFLTGLYHRELEQLERVARSTLEKTGAPIAA